MCVGAKSLQLSLTLCDPMDHIPPGFLSMGFSKRKGRGTRDQMDKICWIIEKQENSRKTSISASLTTLKPLCGLQQPVENS